MEINTTPNRYQTAKTTIQVAHDSNPDIEWTAQDEDEYQMALDEKARYKDG